MKITGKEKSRLCIERENEEEWTNPNFTINQLLDSYILGTIAAPIKNNDIIEKKTIKYFSIGNIIMNKRTRINVKFCVSLEYLKKEEEPKSFERICRYLDINDLYNFIVDLYIDGTKVFKSSITDINIIMTEIEIIYPVSFTKNGFIHSKVLNQYDLDGQIDILSHFLRTQDWEIVNDEIIFPKLINDKYIQTLLKTFEKEYIINNESQKNIIINECEVFGIATTKKNIQNKIQKEKSNKEKLEIILNSNEEFYSLSLKKYNPKFTQLGNKNNNSSIILF